MQRPPPPPAIGIRCDLCNQELVGPAWVCECRRKLWEMYRMLYNYLVEDFGYKGPRITKLFEYEGSDLKKFAETSCKHDKIATELSERILDEEEYFRIMVKTRFY